MSIQRIMAIFEKDLKDFTKNMTILFMPIVPIFLAIVYSRIGESQGEIPLSFVYLVTGAALSAVTTGCMMVFMAEENEKQTLRGLTLSPASFGDIIVGKSLVTFVLTLLTLIISFFFIGFDAVLTVKATLGLILVFFFFLFLGIGTGLFIKSVGMTSAYMLPIMFIFGFTPMIEAFMLEEGSLALKIAYQFPLFLLIKIGTEDAWKPLIYLLPWVIVAGIFMYICYVRTRQDD